jgi:hypothetical protein
MVAPLWTNVSFQVLYVVVQPDSKHNFWFFRLGTSLAELAQLGQDRARLLMSKRPSELEDVKGQLPRIAGLPLNLFNAGLFVVISAPGYARLKESLLH